MKKSGKFASSHMLNLNNAIHSLRIVQISLGIVALYKRFMMESGFLQSSPLLGTVPLFQLSALCQNCNPAQNWCRLWKQLLYSNYRNRVRWILLASHRMESPSICLKISAWIALSKTYQIIPLSSKLFSHLVNILSVLNAAIYI